MDKNYFIKLTSKLYRLTLFFPENDPLREKMRKLGADILANLIFILEGAFYQSRALVDNTRKDVEALICFFEVVRTLNWIDPSDLLEIQKEYSKISDELKRISEIQAIKISEIEGFGWEREKKGLLQQRSLLSEEKGKNQNAEIKSEAQQSEIEEIELSQLKPKESSFEAEETEKENNLQVSKRVILDRQKKILEVLKERGRAQVKDFKEIFPGVSKRTLRRDFRNLMAQGLVERMGEKNNTFYQLRDRTYS